ncbi:MAG: hypothetical protein V1913_15935 [Fibrobacterota bacterium]
MIAITTWNGIISPLFDAARFLTLYHAENKIETVPIANLAIEQKIELLKSKEADCLVCGAISLPMQERILGSGIRLFAWVRGAADEVYAAYIKGELSTECFRMPGCAKPCGCNRKRHRRRQG